MVFLMYLKPAHLKSLNNLSGYVISRTYLYVKMNIRPPKAGVFIVVVLYCFTINCTLFFLRLWFAIICLISLIYVFVIMCELEMSPRPHPKLSHPLCLVSRSYMTFILLRNLIGSYVLRCNNFSCHMSKSKSDYCLLLFLLRHTTGAPHFPNCPP